MRSGAPLMGGPPGAAAGSTESSSVGDSAGLGASGGSSQGGSIPADSCQDAVAPTGASSCDFNSYAFDPDAKHCRYFPKSNCAVTGNRFDTLEACVAACDPGGLDRCQLSLDCAVRNTACCGGCEPLKLEDLHAVSTEYADVDTCPGVACGACAPYDGPQERPYYGARCTNQHCELFDVRNTELARCNSDGDCLLREGLECCECASAGPWVAVNTQRVLAANFLGCAPGTCPTCEHASRENLRAGCVDGQCVVTKTAP